MKSIKILSVLALFFMVVLFQSCEDDPCEGVVCLNDGICFDGTCDCSTGYSGADCGTHCNAALFGTWDVTRGITANCDFVRYSFAPGLGNIRISIIDGGNGTANNTLGTLSFDCSTMTYEFPGLFSGTITFNGAMFTDVIDNGCTIEATKQ